MKQLLRLFYGIKAFVTLTRNPDALGEVFNLSDQLSDDEKLQEIADFLAQHIPAASADGVKCGQGIGAEVFPLAAEIVRQDGIRRRRFWRRGHRVS